MSLNPLLAVIFLCVRARNSNLLVVYRALKRLPSTNYPKFMYSDNAYAYKQQARHDQSSGGLRA